MSKEVIQTALPAGLAKASLLSLFAVRIIPDVEKRSIHTDPSVKKLSVEYRSSCCAPVVDADPNPFMIPSFKKTTLAHSFFPSFVSRLTLG